MEIVILRGNEHAPRWIQADHENDLFHDAFLQAAAALEEIREMTDKYEKARKECERNPRENLQEEELLYCFGSNRIAFCGKRGQGKTSAMLSFARNLGKNEKLGKGVLVLPTIDPTMLEPKDSILNVILARMFQKVREIWEDDRNCGRKQGESMRQDLTECFQLCMEGIATSNSRKEQPPDEFSGLDQLEKLGDSAKLKNNFLRLVKTLLQFSGISDEEGYVVIPLDDTDLQFQTAYNILEDLRKYLAIPHVVLLMALHLEQMRDLVEKQYMEYFPQKNADEQTIRLKASRYIDKMFPAKHVVFLPQFEHFCRDSYRTLELSYEKDIIPKRPLQEGVLHYIYQKTGLLFIVPSKYLHNMIPDSLRGLSQLLNLLSDMYDIPPAAKQTAFITDETAPDLHNRAKIALRNLQLFESYFLHEWCVGELTPAHAAVLKSANQVALSIQIPKLYDDIDKMYPNVRSENAGEKGTNADEKDTNARGFDGQTMYSRLVELLDRIALKRDAEIYRFCFAVRTYIMLQLHKMVWWTRAEAKVASSEPVEDKEAVPSPTLSYPRLVEMLEGTLFLLPREGTYAEGSYIKCECPEPDLQSTMKKPEEFVLLVREVNGKYCYDYTRPLCGVLLQDVGKLQNDEKTDEAAVYSWQEASLMIVLNWDIQDQMRNLDILKNGVKTPYEMYNKLKQRLKEKQVDKIIGQDKESVLDGILSFWNSLKNSDVYKAFSTVIEKGSNSESEKTMEDVSDNTHGNPMGDDLGPMKAPKQTDKNDETDEPK